jgi:hypothetical protein
MQGAMLITEFGFCRERQSILRAPRRRATAAMSQAGGRRRAGGRVVARRATPQAPLQPAAHASATSMATSSPEAALAGDLGFSIVSK